MLRQQSEQGKPVIKHDRPQQATHVTRITVTIMKTIKWFVQEWFILGAGSYTKSESHSSATTLQELLQTP